MELQNGMYVFSTWFAKKGQIRKVTQRNVYVVYEVQGESDAGKIADGKFEPANEVYCVEDSPFVRYTEEEFSEDCIVLNQSDDFVIRDGSLYKYLGNQSDVTVPKEVTRLIPQAFANSSVRILRFGKTVEVCDIPREYLDNSPAWQFGEDKLVRFDAVYFEGTLEEYLSVKYNGGLVGSDPDDGLICGNPAAFTKRLYVNGELMEDVVIPETITVFPTGAFTATCVRSVRFGSNVQKIEEFAMTGSAIKNIYFDGTLEDWCRIAKTEGSLPRAYDLYVQGERIENLKIPKSIDVIYPHAFEGCNLKKVIIPDWVEAMFDSAFANCSQLKIVYCTAKEWANIKFYATYASDFHFCPSDWTPFPYDVHVYTLVDQEQFGPTVDKAYNNGKGNKTPDGRITIWHEWGEEMQAWFAAHKCAPTEQ